MPVKPELSFKYDDGKDRKAISMRLPPALLEQIDKIASRKGWTRTEVFQYALDQLCQLEIKGR